MRFRVSQMKTLQVTKGYTQTDTSQFTKLTFKLRQQAVPIYNQLGKKMLHMNQISHSHLFIYHSYCTSQQAAFSNVPPPCPIICFFNELLCANCCPHTLQTKGLSPVCTRIWVRRLLRCENPLPQTLQ